MSYIRNTKGLLLNGYRNNLNKSLNILNIKNVASCNAILNKQPTRLFSSAPIAYAQQPTRFIVQDFGVFDDYIPIPKNEKPSLMTPEGRKLFLKNMRFSMGNLFGVGLVKMSVKGWKPKVFAEEAELLYKAMNEAYAKGDLETLQVISTPTYFQKMKSEIKGRTGRFEWNLEKRIEDPRVISVRVGRIADGLTLSQVVVKISNQQSLSAFDKRGKKVGSQEQNVEEYVVFQRMISSPDSNWQLYGKVIPKPLNQLLIKK
ncbi:hypothetical protein K502DRAFT_302625 [Neoconidiobolus thromboides FSU 785]|nr:hypothetical protein K502DRAFT_302625 [Neoconidiobolus thromboides FSU 785]